MLAPQGLVMMAMSAVSAALTKAKGPKVTLMVGALIVAAGYGLNTLMRSLGTSFASALAGVILAQMTTDFGGYALPSDDGFKVVMAIGAGAALLAFASFIPKHRPAVRAPEGPAGEGPAGERAEVAGEGQGVTPDSPSHSERETPRPWAWGSVAVEGEASVTAR